MTDGQKQFTDKPIHADRKLGDEWAEWVGDLSTYEKEIQEGKRLFLLFYFCGLTAVTAVTLFLYYLIAPRLYQAHPFIDNIVLWLVIIVFGAIYFWSLLLLLTISTNINFMFVRRKTGLHIEWIYPVVYKIAGMFNISKDRIGHSLLKVNNALIYATKRKFTASNLLVLLPRCLDADSRTKVTALTQRYGCTVFTATGGQSARNMLKKVKPDAIIGVACERDLVSGMADSPHYVPIIAITNKRPHGPCKDTVIDVEALEKAVKNTTRLAGQLSAAPRGTRQTSRSGDPARKDFIYGLRWVA
jgi:hypothetical protein